MDNSKKKRQALVILRWVASTAFLFFAGIKIKMILMHGLAPYRLFSETVGWPATFQYYGVIAVLIEFSAAIMLWIKSFFDLGIVLMAALTLAGVGISFYSLYFKMTANCGCGLFGDNEYTLLAQKLLILLTLIILLLNKEQFFSRDN